MLKNKTLYIFQTDAQNSFEKYADNLECLKYLLAEIPINRSNLFPLVGNITPHNV